MVLLYGTMLKFENVCDIYMFSLTHLKFCLIMMPLHLYYMFRRMP